MTSEEMWNDDSRYHINIPNQFKSIYKMNDEKKRNDRCMKDIDMIILENK